MTTFENAAMKKWDGAHNQQGYRKRFIQSCKWYRQFANKVWLGGGSPHSILKSAVGNGAMSALELAGGRGDFSLYMLQNQIAQNVHMIDLSEQAVRLALEKAKKLGVENFTASTGDVDKISIKNKYDLVVFSQSLHHIKELEHVAIQIKNSLKPGGCLYVSDYIGPSMMQWSNSHLKLLNDCLDLIPGKLKNQILPSGEISANPKTEIKRIPIETFLRVDPSEAVRSEEIADVLRCHFSVEFFPMPGAITYELFRGIAFNFDTNDETIISLGKAISMLEYELTQAKKIEPYFGIFVCKSKD